LLILNNQPFALSADIAMTHGSESMILHHYDGTLFYISEQVRFDAAPSSVFFNGVDPTMLAEQAADYLIAKFAVVKAAADPQDWPWLITKTHYTGPAPRGGAGPSPAPPAGTMLLNQPALLFVRQEPVGVGNLPDRSINIIGMPQGQIEGTWADLIGNLGTIFDPGRDGIGLTVGRYGIGNRAAMAFGYTNPHDHTPITPYVASPPVG
jgi:hypothetical protein